MRNIFKPNNKPVSVAGLLRIKAVGPGYIVLRNPEQYVSIFRMAGGLNPWMEDPDVLGEKIRKLDSILTDLRRGEEVQFLTKRIKADAEGAIEKFDERIHDNAPEVFRNQYPEFLRNWLRQFYRQEKICYYRSFVLFTIPPPRSSKPTKDFSKIEEVLRRGKSWASQLNMVGMDVQELSLIHI